MTLLKIKKSLRARLTLILLLVALLPLFAVEILSYQQAKAALQKAALQEVALLNRASAQEIENLLPQFTADLLSLSTIPPLQAIIRLTDRQLTNGHRQQTYDVWVAQLNQIFVSHAENKKFYHQMRYLDRTGQEVAKVTYDGRQARVSRPAALQNQQDTVYFQETSRLSAGEIYISEVRLKRQAGEIIRPFIPLIYFATPIFDPAGQFSGLLVFDVYAASFLDRLHLDTERTYLVDEQGYYLLHPDPTKQFGAELGHDYHFSQDFAWAVDMMSHQAAFVSQDATQQQVVALEKVPIDPRQPTRHWLIIRSIPHDIVLADLQHLSTIILGLVGGVVVIVSGLALWMARSITEPVSLLAKASEKVAQGHWDACLPMTRQDEIGQLANSFRDMAHQLHHSIETLRQNEARYRAISELTSDYIYSITINWPLPANQPTDVHRHIALDWSTDAFTSLTGYTLPELETGGGWQMLVHPDDWPAWQESRQRAIMAGESQVSEYRIITKEQQTRWLRDHWRPQWDDEQSRVSHILGAASDITRQKEAEEERETLLTELWRLTAIIENTSDFVGLINLNGQMMYVNPAGRRMVGRQDDDLKQLQIYDFLAPPPVQSISHQDIMPTIMDKGVWEGELIFQHVDGRLIPTTQVLMLITNEAGDPIAIGSIARDVTDIKRAKQELQAAKEAAEAASRAKSEFLANMSHEFRTPLNGILGYTQILLKEAGISPKQQHGLETIERSGEHLLTLINDVLDLSKVEAGKMELQPTDFHLPSVLQTIADLFRVRAEQKGLTFLYDPYDLPEGVRGDEKRLRQILINLLGNAFKFTETGRVVFRVRRLTTSPEKRSNGASRPVSTSERDEKFRRPESKSPRMAHFRFEIEDTGVGIAPEARSEIFLPFHQTGHHRQHIEGTGLGLAISRTLVEMMGGTLQLESQVGQGSTFWFEIALEQRSCPRQPTRVANQSNCSSVAWPNDLVVPSTNDMAHLVDLAKRGNIRGLVDHVELLTHQDDQLFPFANQLRDLAKGFKMKEIRKFLHHSQTHLSNEESDDNYDL